MTMFHGLSAFPLTPVDATGAIEADVLGRFLEKVASAGPDSIGPLGSTGGYAYMTLEQRQRALRIAVDAVGGRVPLVVGVGALRTDEAQLLARDARKAGADGLLLAPMSYLPLTDEEVFQHFAAVAEVGELPLCIYNNPSTTRFAFSDDLIGRLAALPHVVAVKMPLPGDVDCRGELARRRVRAPGGFAIGYSGDWGAADALLAGGDAWYSVVAVLLPESAVALVRAAQAGDAAEARSINSAFAPLWELFKAYGSFRVMYLIADLLGLGTIVPPRPVLPLPVAERDRVEAALQELESNGKPAAHSVSRDKTDQLTV